jgi:hypothetical protein
MMARSDCAQVLPVKRFSVVYRDVVIRVCDDAGNVIETQEHAGEFKSHERSRQAKIAEFAKAYGFRLRFYQKGLCAIFGKWPRSDFTDASDARLRNPSKQKSSRR